MDGVGIGLVISAVIFAAAICLAAKFADVFYMNNGDDNDILR